MDSGTRIDHLHDLANYPTVFDGFVESYRTALERDGVPSYQDFLLEDGVVPYLTAVTVLDLREPNVVRYRMCGSTVVYHVGADLTGQNMLELVQEEDREDLYADMLAMIKCPCGNFAQHLDSYASGKSVKTESLSLPLKPVANSEIGFVITLYASEWAHLSDSASGKLPTDGDMQIGVEWLQSVFVDIGSGTPGLTSLQRGRST